MIRDFGSVIASISKHLCTQGLPLLYRLYDYRITPPSPEHVNEFIQALRELLVQSSVDSSSRGNIQPVLGKQHSHRVYV